MREREPDVDPIGVVGLGLMGAALVERLIGRGLSVIGTDIECGRRDELTRTGGRAVERAAEVFRACDRVFLSLPTHVEVEKVAAEVSEEIRPGQIVIDTTTGDPEHAERIARDLADRGVVYLDATISGNSTQVRAGQSSLLVGGDAAAYAACADLFSRLGGRSFHTGASGTGARMKLVSNLVLGLNRAALAEGLALGEAMGFDPALTLEVLRGCPAYSRAMDVKGEKMVRSEFSPEARLSQHLKDVRLMLAAGADAGLPMPLSRAHREVLEQAEAAGLGALDNSALIEVMRGRAARPAAE